MNHPRADGFGARILHIPSEQVRQVTPLLGFPRVPILVCELPHTAGLGGVLGHFLGVEQHLCSSRGWMGHARRGEEKVNKFTIALRLCAEGSEVQERRGVTRVQIYSRARCLRRSARTRSEAHQNAHTPTHILFIVPFFPASTRTVLFFCFARRYGPATSPINTHLPEPCDAAGFLQLNIYGSILQLILLRRDESSSHPAVICRFCLKRLLNSSDATGNRKLLPVCSTCTRL